MNSSFLFYTVRVEWYIRGEKVMPPKEIHEDFMETLGRSLILLAQ